MRVVVCTIVHHPADARIYHRQIRALLEAGHQVIYIAPVEVELRKEVLRRKGLTAVLLGKSRAVDKSLPPERLRLIQMPSRPLHEGRIAQHARQLAQLEFRI